MNEDFSTDRCPDCGETFKKLGSHWMGSSHCRPPDYQPEHTQFIAAVLLLGEGNLRHVTAKQSEFTADLILKSADKGFLEWTRDLFGPLSGDVKLTKDAETRKQELLERGVAWAKDADIKNNYAICLRRHRQIRNFVFEWCSEPNVDSGYPVVDSVPNGVRISPFILNVLYYLRGSYFEREGRVRINISKSPADERFWERKLPEIESRVYEHDNALYWEIISGTSAFHYMDLDLYTLEYPIPGFDEKTPDLGILSDASRVNEIERELGLE